jgi:serine/threonine-protein kinase
MSDDLASRLANLPGYSIEREIGGGGMSRVFLAHEHALGRRVVIKVLEAAGARVDAERFRREVLLSARLTHPHIVPLLTAGEVDGLSYYIMPYVEGLSLRARLRADGVLPVGEAIRLIRNVAAALACAHEQGIIHRDIKPDNIIVTGGLAVVLDFGVSKALAAATAAPEDGITGAGLTIGTPRYMAPEQVVADPNIDARADLYALGVLAYELLSGATPFGGNDPVRILRAHIAESPAPLDSQRPGLPAAVGTLVMRCLEKDRTRRPQSAVEVLDLLDAMATPGDIRTPTFRQAAARSAAGAGAALVPALIYIVASAAMIAGLRWLEAQGQVGARLLVLSVVGALLGLPVVVGLALLLGLRRAERSG